MLPYVLISFDGQEEELCLNEMYWPETISFTVKNPNSLIEIVVKNVSDLYQQWEHIGQLAIKLDSLKDQMVYDSWFELESL